MERVPRWQESRQPVAQLLPTEPEPPADRVAAQIRLEALEELGPTFVKFGQALSTRVDLLPEDLIEILTVNGLHYSHNTESGVLFHLIGALSQYGKLGLTAIAPPEGQSVGELVADNRPPRSLVNAAPNAPISGGVVSAMTTS